MDDYEITRANFGVAVLEGGPQAIGEALAEWLGKTRPEALRSFTMQRFDPASRGYGGMKELWAACERACPGLPEEIAAFAARLKVKEEQLAFWLWSALPGSNCSQAAIAPMASATGTALVMRSYEWRPDQDDLLLCITRKTGKHAHIGCSSLLFGRMDGLNDQGLSVTMSGGMAAGLPQEWQYRRGLNFWVVIRGLLETCASVAEAVAHLRENTPTGNHNLILADAAGQATLAEIHGGEMALRERGSQAFIASTNHFTLEPLAALNKLDFILANSRPRLAFIQNQLEQARPRISPEDLQHLLAGEVPNGCFGPWYSQGFGTLWASIFDLGQRRASYCFGAPGFGQWRDFGFDAPVGFSSHPAVFPEKRS